MEQVVESSEKDASNEEHMTDELSEPAKSLVTLIVRIVVNATLRELYEKEGDKISEV